MIKKALNEEDNSESQAQINKSMNSYERKKMLAQASKQSFPETVDSLPASDDEQNDSLMQLLNERVEAADRGDGIRLEDFTSGNSMNRAHFIKDHLRPSSDATIHLLDPEVQLIGLLNFMITLRDD